MNRRCRNHEILSIEHEGVEYRCQQYEYETTDMHHETWWKTKRTKWLSKKGVQIEDALAMRILEEKGAKKENDELMQKLWGEE